MCTPTHLDHTLFRVLLYRNDASEILLETSPEGFRLPILTVRAHRREAEEITAAIRTLWNLETYGLFRLSAAVPRDPVAHDYVVEGCQPDEASPDRMEWLSVGALCVGVFQSPSDLAAIHNSLRMFDQYRRDELPGSFGKPGWLQTVAEWVGAQAAATGLHLTGTVRQFNASPTFSLLRFETDGPALWFKAVGEPNLREFKISCILARLFPTYVPEIVASRANWNAWLMTEFGGKHPEANSNMDVWITVAKQLADLQIASLGRTLHLVDAGCHDTRVCSLAEMINPFLEVMAELMGTQTKASPAPLSPSELSVLGAQLREIFSSLVQSNLPNTLSHLDLHPGNVLVSNGTVCSSIGLRPASVIRLSPSSTSSNIFVSFGRWTILWKRI
jgi:hypothetical protein